MASESSFPVEEITEDTLLPILKTRALGRRVFSFGQCESTNLFARRLLEGRPNPPPEHGTLIVAEEQTGGRGRAGRRWVAPRGSSLLFTLILHPGRCAAVPQAGEEGKNENAPSRPNRITLAAGAAAARALAKVGVAGCAIKWPNDVLASDGRKLCGILTERVARPNGGDAYITGIGINVNQTEADFPEELRGVATSARMAGNGPVSRLRLLKEMLEEFEACLAMSEERLFDVWERNCRTLGQTVRVRMGNREALGLAVGLEKDGSLILRRETGQLETVISGDVEELRAIGDDAGQEKV